MGYDPSKQVWLNPNIEYLFGEDIIEYDIRDAGFNIIQQFKMLPDEKIRELVLLGKGIQRHIAIGKLQRDDKEFSKRLQDKFTDVRRIFISANNLNDSKIIAVKKDAIFTIGECSRIKFGKVEFIPKNRYTSYMLFPDISNLEVYYNDNMLDIKGMGDSAINRHRLYMYEFIHKTMGLIENNNNYVKRHLKRFISDYKSSLLDEAFYIEFNNRSRDLNPWFNYHNIIIRFVQIITKEMG